VTLASQTVEQVRAVLREQARVPNVDALADDDDLFEAGLTSHASVDVLLALEEELAVEFPDELITRSTFSSIASISAALGTLVRDS
jgi:acyl carrier protein